MLLLCSEHLGAREQAIRTVPMQRRRQTGQIFTLRSARRLSAISGPTEATQRALSFTPTASFQEPIELHGPSTQGQTAESALHLCFTTLWGHPQILWILAMEPAALHPLRLTKLAVGQA